MKINRAMRLGNQFEAGAKEWRECARVCALFLWQVKRKNFQSLRHQANFHANFKMCTRAHLRAHSRRAHAFVLLFLAFACGAVMFAQAGAGAGAAEDPK